MGYDSQNPTEGRGSVKIQHGELKNVRYVPSLATNLLSVYHMIPTCSPKRVTFDSDSIEITEKATGQIIVKGIANHSTKSYEFSHFFPVSPPIGLLTHANNTSNIWHEIFGHLNFKYLQQFHNDKMVEGLLLIQTSDGVCSGCLVGKHPKKRYEIGNAHRDASILDLIHSDVVGPIPTTSINGYRYFLILIDDCSRFCWI